MDTDRRRERKVMVTRNDVAKLAGVSPAVVSYVLNNSNYVSEEKRCAVLNAVAQLGYFPNSAARSLKEGKSKQFLIITDDVRSELFAEVTFYMEREASESGYSIAISSCTQKNFDEYLDSLMGRQYAGIFLFSGIFPLVGVQLDKINRLAEAGMPVVLFKFIQSSAKLHPSITLLQSNISEAVCKAVDYLHDVKGHEIVGYIGDGNPCATGETLPFGDGLRVKGYLESERKHRREPDKRYVFFLDENPPPHQTFMNVEVIVEQILAMSENERPTAYFVNSDILAAKLMARFRSLEIYVPQDVEIVGFGDTLSATITNPQLTTVGLPCQAIGEQAVYALLQKAKGEPVANGYFAANFIKRDSA